MDKYVHKLDRQLYVLLAEHERDGDKHLLYQRLPTGRELRRKLDGYGRVGVGHVEQLGERGRDCDQRCHLQLFCLCHSSADLC